MFEKLTAIELNEIERRVERAEVECAATVTIDTRAARRLLYIAQKTEPEAVRLANKLAKAEMKIADMEGRIADLKDYNGKLVDAMQSLKARKQEAVQS